eukprot:361296-Pelagomonas_calceolata.AAC.9
MRTGHELAKKKECPVILVLATGYSCTQQSMRAPLHPPAFVLPTTRLQFPAIHPPPSLACFKLSTFDAFLKSFKLVTSVLTSVLQDVSPHTHLPPFTPPPVRGVQLRKVLTGVVRLPLVQPYRQCVWLKCLASKGSTV